MGSKAEGSRASAEGGEGGWGDLLRKVSAIEVRYEELE